MIKTMTFEDKLIDKINFYNNKVIQLCEDYKNGLFMDVREFRLSRDNYIIRLDELKRTLKIYKRWEMKNNG